ncbi:MAG: coproporphyrinogen III oxidase [Proteobacteria bacterium]|nr:coproporphyrinogen III oxidase [Pseudomonadota bacterium]
MSPTPTRVAPAPEPAGDLAVYVHWPFCESKCPYCSFNSHVRDGVDQGRWRRALLAELDHGAAPLAGRRVGSLFFGGGTPSLMSPETVAAVIARVGALWPLAPDLEVTLEANPSSAEAGRFAELAAAGVDRLSLGVQALDEAALRFLGRRHGVGEALAALAAARATFPRVSLDLIYARPGQSRAAWLAELDRALALQTEHLSLYQLTIEPGTGFWIRHRRGEIRTPREQSAAVLFAATEERMAAAGLRAYEVSNYARPGAECRHNLAYWRGGDYLGVGPGAHGRITLADGPGGERRTVATARLSGPEAWLERVEAEGHGTRESVALSRRERIEELVMMGLRLDAGIERDRFARLAGEGIEEAIAPARLAPLIEQGFLLADSRGLRATAAGRLRLDAVLAFLLA